MKNPQAFTCDVCTNSKSPTADWSIVFIGEAQPADCGFLIPCKGLVISPWHEDLALHDVKHVCGNSCTQKLVERYLHSGTLEAARVAGGAA